MNLATESQFTQLAAILFNNELNQFSQERASDLLNAIPKKATQHSSTYTHNKSIPIELQRGTSRDISLKGQFAETCRRSAEMEQFEHVVIFEPNEMATEPVTWQEKIKACSRDAIDAASRKVTDEIMKAIYKPTQVTYSSYLAGQSGLYDLTEITTIIDATTSGLTVASVDAAIALLGEYHGCDVTKSYPSKGYLICDYPSLNNLQADMRLKSTPNVQFNIEEQLETYRNLRLLPVSNVRQQNLGIQRYYTDAGGNLYLPLLKADAIEAFYSTSYASSFGGGDVSSLISSYKGDISTGTLSPLAGMFSLVYMSSNPAYNDKPSLAIRGMFGALRVDPTQMAFIKSKPTTQVAGPYSSAPSAATVAASSVAPISINTASTASSKSSASKGE